MQGGKPIAYASKTLSDAETRYANIERELIAVVFGCERFHTYLYGKSFTVESDHKPLEMIQRKPLTAAPPRLQRMLLRLQPYDVTIRYCPEQGRSCSRLFVTAPSWQCRTHPSQSRTQARDRKWCRVDYTPQHDNEWMARATPRGAETATSLLGFPRRTRSWGRSCSKGWEDPYPQNIANVHPEQAPWGPPRQRKKKRLRAKGSMYWPSINDDIEAIVKDCSVCLEHKHAQPHEPLLQHEIPTRPWQVLGTDLFHFEGDMYLIIADYFSKFPLIRKNAALIYELSCYQCNSSSVRRARSAGKDHQWQWQTLRLFRVQGLCLPLSAVERLHRAYHTNSQKHVQESESERHWPKHGTIVHQSDAHW